MSALLQFIRGANVLRIENLKNFSIKLFDLIFLFNNFILWDFFKDLDKHNFVLFQYLILKLEEKTDDKQSLLFSKLEVLESHKLLDQTVDMISFLSN